MTQGYEKAAKELGISFADYEGLLQCFSDQAVGKLSELDQAVARKDMNEISSIGHFFKGAAANIRLVDLERISAQIESIIDQKIDFSQVQKMTTELKSEIKKLKS